MVSPPPVLNEGMGKQRKCPSLLIFNRIEKRQKRSYNSNLKIRAPSFLKFFDQSNIDHIALIKECPKRRATAFSLRLGEQILCLEQSYSCLFQPLYACTCPNLQVTYSDIFIETLRAHTLLGTVIQLFIPASVHLYMDKPAGYLLWTNLKVPLC
jgi:hypothetical protein